MDADTLVEILKDLDFEVRYLKNELVINDSRNKLDDGIVALLKESKKDIIEYLKKNTL